jgi:hypothetical protein
MTGHVLEQDQGIFGLFLAFSAGEQLQLWIDEGNVWHRAKGREPRLLSYDETPFSYVSQISFYMWWAGSGWSGWRLVVAQRRDSGIRPRSGPQPRLSPG